MTRWWNLILPLQQKIFFVTAQIADGVLGEIHTFDPPLTLRVVYHVRKTIKEKLKGNLDGLYLEILYDSARLIPDNQERYLPNR